MFIGTLFLTGYNFIGSLLRAFGDSRTPMYFVLLATVLTAVLNPLFITGFGLGIAGAAWAMILAQTMAFLYSLYYLSGRSETGLPAVPVNIVCTVNFDYLQLDLSGFRCTSASGTVTAAGPDHRSGRLALAASFIARRLLMISCAFP